ncbi:polyamine aminopropyltransferase [Undibacterium fentianense]|uniref:Polyamine aminopropyltransferase n=1 Tax=Undibacterium fentianense TaxID=2828728 RepID=A0A941IFK4_9BURK|nr:polyamine aminopropyltransferase [Undibacterium fentianense]MBR7799125.1 polyamine aminopropyltransferase [Undibacterium fentianense]
MEGLHLTADCYACQCDHELLIDQTKLSDSTRAMASEAGLTIVGEKFYPFKHADGAPAGVTGALLLAESHIAIHTWPERRTVTLDIYVCNFEKDNSDKARIILQQLINHFQPEQISKNELMRGLPIQSSTPASPIAIEHLSANTSMQTKISATLVQIQSEFQLIEIAETPEFGKIMRIDGAMMTSEADEFYYHESLVHPAAITHEKLETVLIIGGGDGGSTEELLKYPSIRSITLCEIDPMVIALAKEYFQQIHRNAFDSEKVSVIHTDGYDFIKTQEAQFDLIVLDLTDPISPNGNNIAESCSSKAFYESCYSRLKPGGSIVLHLGSPFYHQERYQATLSCLHKVFDLVRPYSVFIPIYGAQWGMAIACKANIRNQCFDPKNIDRQTVDTRLTAHNLRELQFYNGAVHVNFFNS